MHAASHIDRLKRKFLPAFALTAALALGGCGVAPDSAPPSYDARTAPFDPSASYVIWEVTDPAIDLSGDVWCPVSVAQFTSWHGRCVAKGVLGDDLTGFVAQAGPDHSRIRLNNRFLDLLRVNTAGKMFLAGERSGRLARPRPDGMQPTVSVSSGTVSYLGQFSRDEEVFRSGKWAPEGLRAELIVAGRGDLASALRADPPRAAILNCKGKRARLKECTVSLSNKLFPGLAEE